MKVTELNKELIEEITGTSLYLISAINAYRKKKELKLRTHGNPNFLIENPK